MTIKWLEFAKNMHSLNDWDVFSVYPTKSVGRNGPESNELHKKYYVAGKTNQSKTTFIDAFVNYILLSYQAHYSGGHPEANKPRYDLQNLSRRRYHHRRSC